MAITSVNGVNVQHHQYGVGLNNVGSYQVSGIPFVSGNLDSTNGIVTVTFPYVTQWVQIINHDGAELSCSFSQNGMSSNNLFKIHQAHGSNEGEYPPALHVKCTQMFFTGSTDFDVIAGLTNININQIPTNWSGSTGVG